MFKKVFLKLKKQGINVKSETLKKHSSQGFMSQVYNLESDKGILFLHIVNPNKEWSKQKIWEKIYGVSQLLANYPGIPANKVVLSGKIKDSYFLVQKKISGKQAGKRFIIGNSVVDKWEIKNKNIENLLMILTKIHKIKFKKFGWPLYKNSELQGKYNSWKEFFFKEVAQWTKSIKNTDIKLENRGLLNDYYYKNQEVIYQIIEAIPKNLSSVLIHGDSINPSNLLIDKNKISGLLDWEWSILGDPAWEFCDPGWWSILTYNKLKVYFDNLHYSKSRAVNFITRAKIYRILWLLWGSYMHANDDNKKIYATLRSMLSREMSKLNKSDIIMKI